MNPLASMQDKSEKAMPLVEELEDQPFKKRPFSNCILFVLLAVLVFALACFAVYTAIVMGIPVEKNQSNLAKPESLGKTGLLLSDRKNGNALSEEVNETEGDNILSEALNPKFRVRIFIKASPESNDEFFEEKQNNMKDFFPSRSTLRKMIFRDANVYKPEVDSSQNAFADKDEVIKDVVRVNQIDKSNIPSPLDALFNIFKHREEPIRPSVSNIAEDTKNEPSNYVQTVQHVKSPARTEKHNAEGPIEDFMDTMDKLVSNIMPHMTLNRMPHMTPNIMPQMTPNRMKDDSQESGENDIPLGPREYLDQADNIVENIISNVFGNANANRNPRPTPHVFMQPHMVRIIRFGNPHFLQMGSFPAMNQRTPNNVRFPLNINVMQSSPLSAEDMSFGSEEKSKMDERSPISHPVSYNTVPTLSPQQDSTTEYPEKKAVSGEKFEETTEIPLKDNNKVEKLTYKSKKSPIIDRINTDNVEPFANFVEKYTS